MENRNRAKYEKGMKWSRPMVRYMKISKHHALYLGKSKTMLDGPLIFTLAEWEAELLITPTRFKRIVRWS